MFKNLIFAAVTAASVFVGVAATSAPAEAGPHRHFRHFSHFRGHFNHGQRFARRGHFVIVRNHPHRHGGYYWRGGIRHHYVQRNNFVIVNNYPGWRRHHGRYYGGGPVASYARKETTSCTWRYGYWHSIPAHLWICTTAYF